MAQVTGFELLLFRIGWLAAQAVILWWIFVMSPPVVKEAINGYRNWAVRRELKKLQRYANPDRHCQFVEDWLNLIRGSRTEGDLEEIENIG